MMPMLLLDNSRLMTPAVKTAVNAIVSSMEMEANT
jgi:hypothetical protein